MFSCEYYKIFKNSFFYGTPSVSASKMYLFFKRKMKSVLLNLVFQTFESLEFSIFRI